MTKISGLMSRLVIWAWPRIIVHDPIIGHDSWELMKPNNLGMRSGKKMNLEALNNLWPAQKSHFQVLIEELRDEPRGSRKNSGKYTA